MNDRLDKLFGGHSARKRWHSDAQTIVVSSTNETQSLPSESLQGCVEESGGISQLVSLIEQLEKDLEERSLGPVKEPIDNVIDELKALIQVAEGASLDLAAISDRLRLLDEVLVVHFSARGR